jgi:putative membrane protein
MAIEAVDSVSSLPVSIAYFGTSLLIYTIGLAVHVGLAPYPEFRLVREGNTAAAASLAGAMVGLALPLASVILYSESMLDQLVWSGIAVAAQLLVFAALRRMAPDLNRNVVGGQVASGIVLGALALGIGILNAAAMAAH